VSQKFYESAGNSRPDSDKAIDEFWEERAAVREYDGGLSKGQAERLAAIDTRKEFGRLTDAIERQVLGDGNSAL
jgi:hypothetical protein